MFMQNNSGFLWLAKSSDSAAGGFTWKNWKWWHFFGRKFSNAMQVRASFSGYIMLYMHAAYYIYCMYNDICMLSLLCVCQVWINQWICFLFLKIQRVFFEQRILILHPQIFRIITGRGVFNGMETPGEYGIFIPSLFGQNVCTQCTEKHRNTTVSHFYLLDVFFFNCLVLPCFECCFWMPFFDPLPRWQSPGACTAKPEAFKSGSLSSCFFNGVSDYSIIHNIKIHIRFKHRCLMSKPCLSTIYDTFL